MNGKPIYLHAYMDKKLRVGAVSYLNTKPLIYGFEQGMMKDQIHLSCDYPSQLVSLLQKNEIDIALLPVAALSQIREAHLFSEYGIASDGKVASVCLFSEVPIDEVQEIYLDYQSRSSVALLRLLLKNHWQTRPLLVDTQEDFVHEIKEKKAGLIIGDRALQQLGQFPYVYDLAEAWKEYTQLPFVFATWVSNTPLSAAFVAEFEKTMQYGLDHMEEIIKNQNIPYYDLNTYYHENIAFHLHEERKNGMKMFLRMLEAEGAQ